MPILQDIKKKNKPVIFNDSIKKFRERYKEKATTNSTKIKRLEKLIESLFEEVAYLHSRVNPLEKR